MTMQRFASVLAVLALLMSACGDDDSSQQAGTTSEPDSSDGTSTPRRELGEQIVGLEQDGQPVVALEVIATDVRAPTTLAFAPDDDERIFVLESVHGQVRIIENGALRPDPFLDIADRLEPTGDEETQENGLLAMAFHPDYRSNGRFFVYYVNESGLGELVEYQVSDDPNRADPDSAVVLRQFGPGRMHHGGALFFGPDGALWFGIGDAGPGQNPPAASDITNPRGKLHRYDASTPGTLTAAEGNPFIGDPEGLDELWAFGLRNPWRVSIDAETRLLYIADVGSSHTEEIDVVSMDDAGLDYGWPTVEGSWCLVEGCQPPPGSVTPTLEIVRAEEDVPVCAVIGGNVYHGQAIPELRGAYLYTDLCGGFLRSFRYQDGGATEELEWIEGGIDGPRSIAQDNAGEIYVVERRALLKLVPAAQR